MALTTRVGPPIHRLSVNRRLNVLRVSEPVPPGATCVSSTDTSGFIFVASTVSGTFVKISLLCFDQLSCRRVHPFRFADVLATP